MIEITPTISLIWFLITVTTLSVAGIAYAATDSFQVQIEIIDNDTIAPTAPTGLSATAVSVSQIDLSWSASTDNVGIENYLVYRDSVQIATTTATAYSDTGLSSDTTYMYVLTAVDSAGNVSATSTPAQATTLSTAVDSGGGSVTGGGYIEYFKDFTTQTRQTSAVFTWTSTLPTISSISWGFTPDYEGGSAVSDEFTKGHEVMVSELEQNKTYYFLVRSEDKSGVVRQLQGQFQTLPIPDVISPYNVTDFRVVPEDENIFLSWENPDVDDFAGVRIVRSTIFYPADLWDGEVIFEGEANSFIDQDIRKDVTYYYTIFSFDEKFNYSSGLIGSAAVFSDKEGQSIVDPYGQITYVGTTDPRISAITFADLVILQDNKELIPNSENVVSINSSKPTTFLIRPGILPDTLKTVLVTMKHPDDPSEVFSFLLRANEKNTASAYEATIGPLQIEGIYSMFAHIIDYKNQGVQRLEGALRAEASEQADVTCVDCAGRSLLEYIRYAVYLITLLIIFIILILLLPRRKENSV